MQRKAQEQARKTCCYVGFTFFFFQFFSANINNYQNI